MKTRYPYPNLRITRDDYNNGWECCDGTICESMNDDMNGLDRIRSWVDQRISPNSNLNESGRRYLALTERPDTGEGTGR